MLNYSNARLENLIIHEVGNKLNQDGYKLSDSISKKITEEAEAILTNYFLSPFRQSEYFYFWHESDIELNATFSFIRSVFESKNSFVSKTKNIAKHLYEQSVHPKIKPGELYISYFSNLILDDDLVDAIGIFKSESKDTFLKLHKTENHFEVKTEEGLNINKVEKACLIFNTQAEEGFKVCVIDNTSKSNEAQYWKDDFLKIKAISDNFHFTKNFLSITKDFITKRITEEFEVDKTSQIDLLNRSVGYFKENETFNIKEFEKDVFKDENMIKSFRKFGSSYLDANDIDIADRFEISVPALKQQEKIFKSVLKLDKNFHIYIHGRTDLIEKGSDKNGKFYKIYYKEES